MSSKYVDANRWESAEFSNISATARYLYCYLYDRCDLAGFISVNIPLWSCLTDIPKDEINTILDELEPIIKVVNGVAWLSNHLIDNRNYPLTYKNRAHRGIIKTFERNLNHEPAYKFFSSFNIEQEKTREDNTQEVKTSFNGPSGKGKKPRTTRSTEGFEGRIVEIICTEHPFIRETHKVGSGSIDKYCTKCAKPMERIILKSEMNRSSLSAS